MDRFSTLIVTRNLYCFISFSEALLFHSGVTILVDVIKKRAEHFLKLRALLPCQ
jgi:hypothetical protein